MIRAGCRAEHPQGTMPMQNLNFGVHRAMIYPVIINLWLRKQRALRATTTLVNRGNRDQVFDLENLFNIHVYDID